MKDKLCKQAKKRKSLKAQSKKYFSTFFNVRLIGNI
jgi:hypothetical protein